MSTETNSGKLSQTRRETAESKAETTKRISQEMLRTESELRDAKTMRLRAARLASQPDLPEPKPAKGRKAKKPAASAAPASNTARS
ncbi:hypothetical protein [Labrenzia sp. OB1]|uniref:hypothetical protein n=1 Tax=Labrenzia sp. OB1 TaxID=1561204 RepID=UPI0007B2A9AB|nr:hypothetical protein [Labrenzia sp. OB1]KZM47961.1 hypothetical protein OA90_23205 [Labrenzia sp. OB1]